MNAMSGLPSMVTAGLLPLANANPFSHSGAFTTHGTPKQFASSVARHGKRYTEGPKTGPVLKHAMTSAAAEKFGTVSRNVLRRANFDLAIVTINEVAGGEPRSVRRLMARARAKREWVSTRT